MPGEPRGPLLLLQLDEEFPGVSVADLDARRAGDRQLPLFRVEDHLIGNTADPNLSGNPSAFEIMELDRAAGLTHGQVAPVGAEVGGVEVTHTLRDGNTFRHEC